VKSREILERYAELLEVYSSYLREVRQSRICPPIQRSFMRRPPGLGPRVGLRPRTDG